MAEPYASPSQARTFYAGEDASGVELEVPMYAAANFVQKYAPAPDPEPSDYADTAARAELLVGAYIVETGGYRDGATLSRTGSVTYNTNALGELRSLVSTVMGEYYAGGGEAANTGYIEPW